MPDKNKRNNEENPYITYHEPVWDDNGRFHWEGIILQEKSKNAQAILLQPPTKVIPVIFIPGVMGTNLMSPDEKERAIWRGDSEIDVYFGWVSKDGKTRQDLLNPDTTQVDNRGKISEDIFTALSDNGKIFPTRRERGWGEVLYFSYGKFLAVLQGALLNYGQNGIGDNTPCSASDDKQTLSKGVLASLIGEILGTEEENEAALTAEERDHFAQFLFPVHVFGYNWLQDNKISAEKLITFIDKVNACYRHRGYGSAFPAGKEKVIIVTHSMGGLVARYASEVMGAKEKILGIVHGVMPDLGSPAAYRRMKIGAKQEGAAGIVLGKSAEELMPVLARAPAPLQLLPSASYMNGSPWLTIKGGNADGSDLTLPQRQDPFGEIYLNKSNWWRLYEADIIDKDKVRSQNNWLEYNDLMDKTVQPFIVASTGKYHSNTYSFYGNTINSDGMLLWKKTTLFYPNDTHESDKTIPNDHREVPLPYNRCSIYQLTSSNTSGDGTVPIESLTMLRHHKGIKSILATNVDHQGAYTVRNLEDIALKPAIKFTLRAIAKMAQEAPSPCE